MLSVLIFLHLSKFEGMVELCTRWVIGETASLVEGNRDAVVVQTFTPAGEMTRMASRNQPEVRSTADIGSAI
jgi:hypothetical protein